MAYGYGCGTGDAVGYPSAMRRSLGIGGIHGEMGTRVAQWIGVPAG